MMPAQRASVEMLQRPSPFNLMLPQNPHTQLTRPSSVATEFLHTDASDDGIYSDDESSYSLKSAGGPSITTISTYDEIVTPLSIPFLPFSDHGLPRQVEGPKGPHLICSSEFRVDDDFILTLSPLDPDVNKTKIQFKSHQQPQHPHQQQPQLLRQQQPQPLLRSQSQISPTGQPTSHISKLSWGSRATSSLPALPKYSNADRRLRQLPQWTPAMVAQCMLDSGLGDIVADTFLAHGIGGALLISLQFENLKDLGLSSFSVRNKVWKNIQRLVEDSSDSHVHVHVHDHDRDQLYRDRYDDHDRDEDYDDYDERGDHGDNDDRYDQTHQALNQTVHPDDQSDYSQLQVRSPTPIEDTPSRDMLLRGHQQPQRKKAGEGLLRRQTNNLARMHAADDVISPLDSVSIVGIEQPVPKLHTCPKGENCGKYKKQARKREAFFKKYPYVNPDAESIIIRDAGNPQTAKAFDLSLLRPVSEAVPSVVASSDVLGPGPASDCLPPLHILQEDTLRAVQFRDPQDNVRQFLDFQLVDKACGNVNEPVTPPFDVTNIPFPYGSHGAGTGSWATSPPGSPSVYLVDPNCSPQRLSDSTPTIPHTSVVVARAMATPQIPSAHMPFSFNPSSDVYSPIDGYTVNPLRFGTPFSDMDVPITTTPTVPDVRECSRSVPPDMSYRTESTSADQTKRMNGGTSSPMIHGNTTAHARCQSRASARRPSFPLLPPVEENKVTTTPPIPFTGPNPPLRFPTPWSSGEGRPAEQVLSSLAPIDQVGTSGGSPSSSIPRGSSSIRSGSTLSFLGPGTALEAAAAAATGSAGDIIHQGMMKKRKAKLLRHEWQDGFFTLRGTRLAMHAPSDLRRVIEYIDVDDYAVACSGVASSSRLRAAFKAVLIMQGRSKDDSVGAFNFQLVPQDGSKGAAVARIRAQQHEEQQQQQKQQQQHLTTVNGTGKTHHFAVTSRDERIDWMRELMLAKALRQKGEGFQVSRNGSVM